jgi:hypothetical protein
MGAELRKIKPWEETAARFELCGGYFHRQTASL